MQNASVRKWDKERTHALTCTERPFVYKSWEMKLTTSKGALLQKPLRHPHALPELRSFVSQGRNSCSV
jgi:hypothetical protein